MRLRVGFDGSFADGISFCLFAIEFVFLEENIDDIFFIFLIIRIYATHFINKIYLRKVHIYHMWKISI